MKKFTLLLLALFAFMLIPALNLGADPGDDPAIIILEDEFPYGENPNRSPSIIPIECLYYPSLSCIVAVFHFTLGPVTVEVENLTSGAYYSQVINGTAGAHIIPASNAAGLYRITFILADGTTYSGEYTLT